MKMSHESRMMASIPKLLLMSIAIISLLLFSACSSNEEGSEGLPQIVEVDIQLDTESIQAGKPILISAHVTQGSENVEDAQKVEFELWKKGDETDENKREKVDASHSENGLYSIEKVFPESGTYYVIAHVTAREMHVMPKKELEVS